jgi:hypothetical protein
MRQRDIEDRVVETDDEQAHAQHEQRQPSLLPDVLRISEALADHRLTRVDVAQTLATAPRFPPGNALGVFGTLTVNEVIKSGGTALAVAAEPVLGRAGYWLMSVTALFATAGATSSGLSPATGLCDHMASIGQPDSWSLRDCHVVHAADEGCREADGRRPRR